MIFAMDACKKNARAWAEREIGILKHGCWKHHEKEIVNFVTV